MKPVNSTSSDLALRCKGVTRTFRTHLGLRRREVLRGVDLELARGAVLGLVGPNGSGKTTLMRMLAGVDRPTSGELRVLGGSPEERRVRPRIGWCPEDSPFPEELSARATLELLGSLSGLPRREATKRGDALLERVGLTEHARRPLGRYSRGMRRRFGLAQAWLANPELILLDEPTAGLDAEGFGVLEDLLADAKRTNTSVVLSSHILADLVERTTEVALLLHGRIAAHGDPATLFAREGCWQAEFENLAEPAAQSLASWAESNNARLTKLHPAGRTLLELYRAPSSDDSARVR